MGRAGVEFMHRLFASSAPKDAHSENVFSFKKGRNVVPGGYKVDNKQKPF